jgi:hypothetical protein
MSRQDRIDRREAAQTEEHGYGGSFSIKPMVEAAFTTLRTWVGEGVEMKASWDRTGKQEFPIPLNGKPPEYSAVDIFGASGRFDLSAIGAVGLPVDSLGFAYRVIGDDISIDGDPIIFKGLARKLSSNDHATGNSAAGIEPITMIWTAFNLIRMIVGILNPKLSILLGGNVSCTAVLNGDVLTITFSQCPSVKLVAFWTFTLEVPAVVINQDKAVASLHGEGVIASRIKSREFVFE